MSGSVAPAGVAGVHTQILTLHGGCGSGTAGGDRCRLPRAPIAAPHRGVEMAGKLGVTHVPVAALDLNLAIANIGAQAWQ